MINKSILSITAIVVFVLVPIISNVVEAPAPYPVVVYVESEDPNLLSHAQETWISALEWCESSGNPSAINPNDSDGTASYYSFQFKPATFRDLGIAYGILDKTQAKYNLMSLIKDTGLQRNIVRKMVNDKSIDISRQFPGCVAKIGRPPVY